MTPRPEFATLRQSLLRLLLPVVPFTGCSSERANEYSELEYESSLFNPVEFQEVTVGTQTETGAAMVDLWSAVDQIQSSPGYHDDLGGVVVYLNGRGWLDFDVQPDATTRSAREAWMDSCWRVGEFPSAGTLIIGKDYLSEDSGAQPWVDMALTYDGAKSLVITYTDEDAQLVTVTYTVGSSIDPDAP